MPTTWQMVVTDLDGTLLNSRRELTARTEAALRAVLARGIPVVLATGKTRYSAEHIIDRLHLSTPGIFMQGMLVYDGSGAVRHATALDRDVATFVATRPVPAGCTLVAYSEAAIFTTGGRQDHLDFLTDHHEPEPQHVPSLAAATRIQPIHKFIFLGPADALAALRQSLAAQLNGSAALVQPMDVLLEVVPAGVSKGTALAGLLAEMGLSAANVVAFGDGENDVEMLRLAGMGVAMGNAMAVVKDSADSVTLTNDEDGVAVALERLILNAP